MVKKTILLLCLISLNYKSQSFLTGCVDFSYLLYIRCYKWLLYHLFFWMYLYQEPFQWFCTDSTIYYESTLMPLCLDTEHISDYGFRVKINELQGGGDRGWQERLWWKWAWWWSRRFSSHYFGILSRPIFSQSIIVVWLSYISLHLTSNKLSDLT